MYQILLIGIGGFIGAVSRFLLSKFISNLFPSFPFGTLIVNVSGSLILGFLMYSVSLGRTIDPDFRIFMVIGILGAYTTMSTFAYESFRLLELKEIFYFSLNIFLNIFLCILAIYAGKEISILINK
jgi:CrcB protein